MKKFLKKMGKRFLIIPPVVLGIIAVIWMGKNKTQPQELQLEETAFHVRVITAKPISVEPKAIGYGTAQAKNIWKAIAEVSGKIVKINPRLKKGNFLKKGEEIVFIERRKFELQIAQAKANLAVTNGELRKLSVEEENLKQNNKIEQQRLEILQKELERSERLVLQSGAESLASLDKSRRDLLVQKSQVQAISNSLDLIPSQKEILQAQLKVNKTQIATAEFDLKNTVIRAPFQCRIDSIDVEKGQFIQAGSLLAETYGTKTMEVLAFFPLEKIKPLIQPQNRSVAPSSQNIKNIFNVSVVIRFKVANVPIEWSDAYFSRIDSEIDAKTRMLGVVVALDDPYKKAIPGRRPPLTKGMFCEVELMGTVNKNCLVIPRLALHGSEVYVVDRDSRLQKREVKIEFSQEDFYVIANDSSIQPQEKIIVSDILPAVEGMLLTPVEDTELAMKIQQQASKENSK